MMFPTNNKLIIKKLTNRSLKANKLRNIFIVIAIALTAFLITTVFSIGMSIIESNELQELRMMGTRAHATLTNPTDNQIEKLKSLDYIEAIGLQVNTTRIVNEPKLGDTTLSLMWYDEQEWEKLRKPAMSNIVGAFPTEFNEIMAPTWVLKKMGITEPKIGMEIELDCKIIGSSTDSKKEKFILSSYYNEYSNLRSDDNGAILVSKAFLDRIDLPAELPEIAAIRFISDSDIGYQKDKIEQDIEISSNQKLEITSRYETNGVADTSTLIGLTGLILMIMLSSYLLIYNVLYISISKDIRFFGMLKTIGTTPKQIRKIVLRQALILAAIGIPAGLIMGAITSFIAVPLALSGANNLDAGIKISFNPLIFLGAAIFSLITTFISSRKPSKKAGSISPIEALRYTGTIIKSKYKNGISGSKIYKMALRNIFRDKKRAAIVLISLFLGITIFLTINTLILSMSTDNYIASYVENDFTLKNNTMQPFTDSKQKFDDDFMSKIKNMKGIKDLRIFSKETIILKYDEKLYNEHLKALAQRYNSQVITSETIEKNPNSFFSNLVGLDKEYVEKLNKKLDKPIDIDAFEKGEIALFSTNNPELFKLGSDIIFNFSEQTEQIKIKLGGFLPEFTAYDGWSGQAPNVFISNTKMKQLVSEPLIYSLTIDADSDSPAKILSKLKQIIGDDNEISLEAKLDVEEQFESSKIMLLILGGGLSLVIALIGLLNFVNVMVTGVNARRQEFAIIESIGMTSKQLKKMLAYEGLAYALISCVLISLLGTAISYRLFLLFKTQADYAIFTFPAVPLTICFVMIFTVCIFVPLITYKLTSKKTITERLRSIEG